MSFWDKLKNKAGDVFEDVGDGVSEYLGAVKDRYVKDMISGGEYSEGNRVLANAQVAATQAPPAATVNPNVHANAKAQNVTIAAQVQSIAKSPMGLAIAGGVVLVLLVAVVKK